LPEARQSTKRKKKLEGKKKDNKKINKLKRIFLK